MPFKVLRYLLFSLFNYCFLYDYASRVAVDREILILATENDPVMLKIGVNKLVALGSLNRKPSCNTGFWLWYYVGQMNGQTQNV